MKTRLWGLIFAFCAVTPAVAKNFGAWHTKEDGDISEAFTTSDTGAVFGLLCSREKNKCVYYLSSESRCSEGATYPMLVNGDANADEITGTCHVITSASGDIHALVLTPIDDIAKLAISGKSLGFAQPMVSGQFRVYRFSLVGSAPAIINAADYAAQKTGDQVL